MAVQRKHWKFMRVVPVLALIAGACSLPASAAAPKKLGSAVTVMMLSQITNPAFSSPETVGAAKAVVANINAANGLGGHRIKLVTCDDKGDATTAGNCARTAVADKAVAVVDGISVNGATILPILNAGRIPYLESPSVPTDASNPDGFPINGGTSAYYGGDGELLALSGCTKAAVLYDSTNPVGVQGGDQTQAGVEAEGGTVVASIGVPETATSLTATVAQVDASGATCIGADLVPQILISLLTAIAQSTDPTITVSTIGPAFPAQVADAVGAAAAHVLIVNFPFLPTAPQSAAFVSVMKKGHVTNLSSFAQNVFVGFKMLQSALSHHKGPLTGVIVRKTLDSETNLHVSTVPTPYDFAKPFPTPAYSRLVNLYMVGYSFNGTNFVPLTGKESLINATPALKKFIKDGK